MDNKALLFLGIGLAAGYLLAKKSGDANVGNRPRTFWPSNLEGARPTWPFERTWGPAARPSETIRAAKLTV
jgi:hypothetical protein